MKISKRKRIQYRIRKKVNGTQDRPRLSVYRSNKNIYCQIIDDVNGVTLASASPGEGTGVGIAQAKAVGTAIAEKAKGLNISNVVFDRGGYLFHGRIKALADAARESGLNF